VQIGDPARVVAVPRATVDAVLAIARQTLEDAIDRMKTEAGDATLIAVGGGAFLVPDRLAGVSEVIRVPHGDCANAVGAAIAQISGETDQVYRGMTREAAIAAAEAQAIERAIAAGADRASLQTLEIEDMPLAYLPGNALRVRVRVAGDLRPTTESVKG
jgi:N-methylhydantoinase A/oxoprolinase/acetone carboxylase beta subunit